MIKDSWVDGEIQTTGIKIGEVVKILLNFSLK